MKSLWLRLMICAIVASTKRSGAFAFIARNNCTPYTRNSLLGRQIQDEISASNHLFLNIPSQCVPHRKLHRTTVLPALPICMGRTTDMLRLGGLSAVLGLVSQWGFTRIFQKFDKENASYAAHSLVALIFMIFLSVIGSIGWWNWRDIFLASTPIDRLLVPNDQCRWLATIVAGMLTFWDLPTSLSIPRLRKTDVMAHHFVMSITALVAAVYLPMFYVFFYLGVSEISSIPLVVYDQLCVWTDTNPNPDAVVETTSKQRSLITARTVAQILAALGFTAIRAVSFTYITIRHFIPDVWQVLAEPTRGHATALRFALGASIGFTSLQLYWFSLMLRTMFAANKTKT